LYRTASSSDSPLTIERLYVSAKRSSELAVRHNPALGGNAADPQAKDKQHNSDQRLRPHSVDPCPYRLVVNCFSNHALPFLKML